MSSAQVLEMQEVPTIVPSSEVSARSRDIRETETGEDESPTQLPEPPFMPRERADQQMFFKQSQRFLSRADERASEMLFDLHPWLDDPGFGDGVGGRMAGREKALFWRKSPPVWSQASDREKDWNRG